MASDQKTYRRKPKEKISKNDKYSKRDFNASITAEQAMTEDIKAALSAIYERTGSNQEKIFIKEKCWSLLIEDLTG